MRTIESQRFVGDATSGQAELWLKLIQQGKTLPFRLLVTHEGPTSGKSKGTLAAVETEDEGREQYEFHVDQAIKKGWTKALGRGVELWGGVPAPDEAAPQEQERPAEPQKRKPGRPRKVR